MQTYIISILILFFVFGKLHAQDPAFSQYYSASLFLNPALAGGEDDISLSLNQRSNMTNGIYPYNLSQFSATIPIMLKNQRSGPKYYRRGYIGGWGITVFNETSGTDNMYKVNGILSSIAYFTQISSLHFLSFGIQGGVVEKQINFNKLQWGSQYDPYLGYNSSIVPSIGILNEQRRLLVINAGLVWFYSPTEFTSSKSRKFSTFVGIAASNLNRPDESFFEQEQSRLPVLLKLHGGFKFKVSRQFEIMPNYLILRQNKVTQINMGTYFSYNFSKKRGVKQRYAKAQIGGWYRYGDSFIVLAGLDLRTLLIGISYDFTVSSFNYYNKGMGTVEISLAYKIIKNETLQKRRISHPLF